MSYGANYIHHKLRTELESYMRTQYFGKSNLLISAVNEQIDTEGLLYQKPYIESSPAYQTKVNGIQDTHLPDWLKRFFADLRDENLGIFPAPFLHQINALDSAYSGEDIFVATGTGSGKTECFIWPLMAKLAAEAHDQPDQWRMRGIRALVMYPMNALVSDQISRLRRLIGDSDGRFVHCFHKACGSNSRRPQFGMYTGRTPYPGPKPTKNEDRKLENTLRRLSFPTTEEEQRYLDKLKEDGKIPVKADMAYFLSQLHDGKHISSEEDAELITRFEIQQTCPDILITNYSMLEYMLLRPREAKIWSDTRQWLQANPDNKILFIIDEAHMYRGSSGGEVAFLIRRMLYKLGITRKQIQFILTTASMPDGSPEDRLKVQRFAKDLTATEEEGYFKYITGEREYLHGAASNDISIETILHYSPEDFEIETNCLTALNRFWTEVSKDIGTFDSLDDAYHWMYDNISNYRPFREMIGRCRGEAISLDELSKAIFPESKKEEALQAISTLLAIAPLAKSKADAVLFPARMHMLFRGLTGVYACTNEHCSHTYSDDGVTLGRIMLSDGRLTCPDCGNTVYELYNDRRCGALFFKGYVFEDELTAGTGTYLWHSPGQLIDLALREIHLFIPNTKKPPKAGAKVHVCYLDTENGFLYTKDDRYAGKPGYRTLYYSDYLAKGRPNLMTFSKCPHCEHQLSKLQLTSFSTKGNQSFYNLIQTQFLTQPAVPGKDVAQFPNEGRKVLLFSDSRQRAAKLARDMSDAADSMAARKLFGIAVNRMEHEVNEQSLDGFYDYFCLAAKEKNIQMFHDNERQKFLDDCALVQSRYNRKAKDGKPYSPKFSFANAPTQLQAHLLRLFSGGYNTLYDTAISWLEPTGDALEEVIDVLEERGIDVTEGEFLEVFNAWILQILDKDTALGHSISDDVRKQVRQSYDGGYGLKDDWKFSSTIKTIMTWTDSDPNALSWKCTLQELFLQRGVLDTGKRYLDLTKLKPRLGVHKTWYRCKKCAEITSYRLKEHCPFCGFAEIDPMTEEEMAQISFWRDPVEAAIRGDSVRIIDTEEHTAQLSHKDQRDKYWSKTEAYELRFQDLVQGNETPVDVLSSTTTMEVGIDIGSLIAVGLRNIPPMRENYQQRAGRAGRRGASLSTIITFCEDGPHDSLYFADPVPIFRGDPRSPWIDISSEKLLQRHLSIICIGQYLESVDKSLDATPAAEFLDQDITFFLDGLSNFYLSPDSILVPYGTAFDYAKFKRDLKDSLLTLRKKRDMHPELFGVSEDGEVLENAKSLLDALYEEGIIPTYSFPKDVVSTYIYGPDEKLAYQVERGLDIAISEYAPGRDIVVDKETYQIGGLYFPGSERRKGHASDPAKLYFDDKNYVKDIATCTECGWFGLAGEETAVCPFCSHTPLTMTKRMLRPWGFAPKNAEAIPEAQLSVEYTSSQPPLYSTLPDEDSLRPIEGYKNIRVGTRANQRIIMTNTGISNKGFMVCRDCGAAAPGDDATALNNLKRPYKSRFAKGKCYHANAENVNLGYDFRTDMVVLEFCLDDSVIETDRNNPWIKRAAQSLAEALRLASSKYLDIEYTELVTGYRIRTNKKGTFVDVYLYDSLSSGAGYSAKIAEEIGELLTATEDLLKGCDCDTACHNCLKHYRNQFVHGLLDRHAALHLLNWGRNGVLPPMLTIKQQLSLLKPLKPILAEAGVSVEEDETSISLICGMSKQTLVVYPAMRVSPFNPRTIAVSDMVLRFAKPLALRQITESMLSNPENVI